MDTKKIFIPFSKVDAVKREVSGIVTAELPDKDQEVCAYAESKPYYQAVIDEMGKATDGKNFFPLREMHGLTAAGKCIGFKFNDLDKEIEMTFKVVDDEAWKKVDERVYTGFSQGGRKVGDQIPDPIYKGCMRYVANPSEVSLVDNPCLAAAHFAYVKTDGTVEMRKFLKVEPVPDSQHEVALLKARITALETAAATQELEKGKTKTVAGKKLGPSSFAYVGDPEKTETWKFPVHDAAHARNALARWGQAKGIPADKKAAVHAKIVAAAKKFGIDVDSESKKLAATFATLRKSVRVYVNRHYGKIASKRIASLDTDLGKLTKGMWEVSRFACSLQDLICLFHAVCCEQEWEQDTESEQPAMLADNISDLTDTLLEMVDEEVKEALEEIKARQAA